MAHFTVTGFLMHSNRCWIRGSSSSRSIGLSELHWFFVRYRACFLLEGERYWEIFLGFARSCTKPPPLYGTTWEARRAYLSFFYFCRYRFVLAVLHVDDGSYWSTMGCDSFNVGLPGPAAAPRGSGRGLLSRPLVSPL